MVLLDIWMLNLLLSYLYLIAHIERSPSGQIVIQVKRDANTAQQLLHVQARQGSTALGLRGVFIPGGWVIQFLACQLRTKLAGECGYFTRVGLDAEQMWTERRTSTWDVVLVVLSCTIQNEEGFRWRCCYNTIFWTLENGIPITPFMGKAIWEAVAFETWHTLIVRTMDRMKYNIRHIKNVA